MDHADLTPGTFLINRDVKYIIIMIFTNRQENFSSCKKYKYSAI